MEVLEPIQKSLTFLHDSISQITPNLHLAEDAVFLCAVGGKGVSVDSEAYPQQSRTVGLTAQSSSGTAYLH